MLCSEEDHIHVVLSKKVLRLVASLALFLICWAGVYTIPAPVTSR